MRASSERMSASSSRSCALDIAPVDLISVLLL
jgi:hypothetical protein